MPRILWLLALGLAAFYVSRAFFSANAPDHVAGTALPVDPPTEGTASSLVAMESSPLMDRRTVAAGEKELKELAPWSPGVRSLWETAESPSASGPSQAPSNAPIVASVDLAAERLADGRVVVTGTTNLPDGMVGIINFGHRQSKFVVRDAAFKSEPFSDFGNAIPPGEHRLTVTFSAHQVQPAHVQTRIGPKGAYLTGPLVQDSRYGLGRVVEVEAIVRVADKGATEVVRASDAVKDLRPSSMVRRVQELLHQAGFDPGPIDGISGPKTRAAIRLFQASKGIPADGEVSDELLERLLETASTLEPDVETRATVNIYRSPGADLSSELDVWSTLGDWARASPSERNRLASIIVGRMRASGQVSPLRVSTSDLVACIDEVAEAPSLRSQEISFVATSCALFMQW